MREALRLGGAAVAGWPLRSLCHVLCLRSRMWAFTLSSASRTLRSGCDGEALSADEWLPMRLGVDERGPAFVMPYSFPCILTPQPVRVHLKPQIFGAR